jgi:hypothetical protein
MKNHKLLRVILTPGTESVKEHLTVHLLPIDDGTSLAGDVHTRETTLFQLLYGSQIRQPDSDDLLGRTLQQSGPCSESPEHRSWQAGSHSHIGNRSACPDHLQLLHHNLRRNRMITFLNQVQEQEHCRSQDHKQQGHSSQVLK